jgi:hypothetical protein
LFFNFIVTSLFDLFIKRFKGFFDGSKAPPHLLLHWVQGKRIKALFRIGESFSSITPGPGGLFKLI